MDEEKIDENTNTQKNIDNSGYEDFPKEIVQLLMKTHPIKKDENEDEMSTMSSREEIRAARKHRLGDAKKEYPSSEKEIKPITHELEKEIKPITHEIEEKQITHTKESEKLDFNQTMAVIFDNDEDMVQLVRHKSRKKGYAKGFSTKSTAHFENIEKTISSNGQKESLTDKEDEKEKKARFEMPKRKRIFHNEDENKNSKYNKSLLDSFFKDNEEDEEYDDDETKIKAKNIFLIGGIAIALVMIVLFVQTISLTGKLNKANTQIEDYEKIQAENEELKLNVLTLEEKVGKVKTDGSEDEKDTTTASDETQTPTGEFDTYTIKDGDTYWTIADEVYGDGSLYQKILDFNNLTENDPIKPGEVLKVPKK